MKKLHKYKILTLVLAFAVFACDEDREFNGKTDPVLRFIEDSPLASSVTEGCESIEYTIEIPYVNTSGTATISFAGSTGTYGVDFTVTGDDVSGASAAGFDVDLTTVEGTPNGQTAGSFTINFLEDAAIDGSKTVVMKIADVSASGLSNIKLGDWTGAYKQGSVSIADVDALSFAGTYAITTEVDGGDCAGETFEGTVTLTRVGTTNDYTVSDITFGVYPNCYGNGSTPVNPGTLTITNGTTVSFLDVPDVVYPGDDFDGTGSADACSFQLVIEWSNNYGDGGITTLIKN